VTFVVSIDDMSAFTVSRRRALAGLLLLAAALLVAGRHLAGAGTATAPSDAKSPLEAVEASAPAALVVHVVGAVRRPGLYRLREGSRIADAVERAGGATRRADLSLVNLAAPVADGGQVVVPRRAPAVGAPAGGGATTTGPVHLNTATLEQLDELPGIGPSTAQKILDFRDEHGAFTSVDELDAVPGIGPARLEQLRELTAP
jgi:competence protein ComEA